MNSSMFCLLFILILNGFGRASVPKLLLTVYYESNCPDSKSFILQQLLPAMQLLQERVRTRFVPFGAAMSIDYGFGGFDCKNGWDVCLGNLVQDCTLELLDHRGASDMEKLKYVACEMETNSGSKADYQCAEQANVQPEKVQHCVQTDRGTMLQLDSEYHTSLVAPKVIPTVVFNKVFDEDLQNAAMRDLLGTLCSYLRDTQPCKRLFNKAAWTAIMQRTRRYFTPETNLTFVNAA